MTGKHRLGRMVIVAGLWLGAAGAGCQNQCQDPKLVIEPEKLRTVEPLDLSAWSAEEAAAEATAIPPAEPPEELSLSLENCRSLALENNLDLKVELLAPTLAAESIREQQARFESLFFGNVELDKIDTPSSSTLTSTQEDNINGDIGVQIPLRTGGEIVFDLASGRAETNNTFNTLNPAYDTELSLSISQPLLRDAGVRTNTHAIRVAQYESQISEARTKLEVIRVIANVDRIYWLFYAARRELELRQQEYDLATAQLERARHRVSVGVSPEVEILRAEAGVAARLEGIIIAENLVRFRQRQLKAALHKPGLALETATVLIPQTLPNPIHYQFEIERVIAASLDQRMEMLELELQIARDASAIDFARNQTLPLLALEYAYTVNGLGDRFGKAYDVLYDKNYEDHSVGLQLAVPLGNQAAQSRLRQAVIQRVQRLASRDQRQQQITNEVLTAIDQLETTWQRVLANRQRAILAARDLQAEERQFELGYRTSVDVLDAQERFIDAQSAEINALTDYQIAQVDLAFSTGTVLAAAKIFWEPRKGSE